MSESFSGQKASFPIIDLPCKRGVGQIGIPRSISHKGIELLEVVGILPQTKNFIILRE